ncbi:MAG: hypothetical protein WA151_14240 [Desulfatirhabdiaceae bacterium]
MIITSTEYTPEANQKRLCTRSLKTKRTLAPCGNLPWTRLWCMLHELKDKDRITEYLPVIR